MNISFRSSNDVQIVHIEGSIGPAEAAAVRFKLEEKLNAGRRKVLFDLNQFDIQNETSRTGLLGIFQYCLQRGALTVVCGVPAANWPLLLLTGPGQVKLFVSLSEALDFASKNEPPSVKGRLSEKLDEKKEEEVKESALKTLLEKYEVFQQVDEDDPFRLSFLAKQYKVAPDREILAAERSATREFATTQETIAKLEQENDELALRLKTMMQFRKTPVSGRELQLKQESLVKEIREAELAIAKIKNDSDQKKAALDQAKEEFDGESKLLDQSLRELENRIKTTEENYRAELEALKAHDAQEQAEFESKMPRP